MPRPSARFATAMLGLPSEGNDVLVGDDLANTLSGLGGDDSITGNGGDDLLQGDAGRDLIYGGLGQNTLYGGADADVIFGNDEEPFGPGVGGNDLIYGGGGGDRLEGGVGDDTIYGGEGNDVILSYGGSDRSYGGKGDDLMLAGAGVMNGDAGNDTIQGQDARGGAGNDSLVGDGFASLLSGGLGQDTLMAIAGTDDTLTGGRGEDLFVFFSSDRGVDLVTDFNTRQDTLNLADFGVTAANLADHATQVGGDVQIVVDGPGGGTLTVILTGVDLGDLL